MVNDTGVVSAYRAYTVPLGKTSNREVNQLVVKSHVQALVLPAMGTGARAPPLATIYFFSVKFRTAQSLTATL